MSVHTPVLVDTSIWVDHLRNGCADLADALDRGMVSTHPFVIGELACGQLQNRDEMLGLLRQLPTVQAAANEEALHFIETHRLMARGIGYVDIHLLASVALTGAAQLWTRDRRLGRVAREMALARS